MAKNVFPPGWDEKKVQELIAYYDQQTDEEVAAEIEAAFDQQDEEVGITSPDIYHQVISDGLQGLPPAKLAEIAEFIYFVRKRYLQPEDGEDELRQALWRAELKQMSRDETSHLEKEFEAHSTEQSQS
jgi:hypothetical protein